MQSVSSRIWTHVGMSISYDDNHYTTGTSLSLCVCVCVRERATYIYILTSSGFCTQWDDTVRITPGYKPGLSIYRPWDAQSPELLPLSLSDITLRKAVKIYGISVSTGVDRKRSKLVFNHLKQSNPLFEINFWSPRLVTNQGNKA